MDDSSRTYRSIQGALQSGKHGKVQATLLGLLGGDLEAPGRAVLDQGSANLKSRNVGEAERIGGD